LRTRLTTGMLCVEGLPRCRSSIGSHAARNIPHKEDLCPRRLELTANLGLGNLPNHTSAALTACATTVAALRRNPRMQRGTSDSGFTPPPRAVLSRPEPNGRHCRSECQYKQDWPARRLLLFDPPTRSGPPTPQQTTAPSRSLSVRLVRRGSPFAQRECVRQMDWRPCPARQDKAGPDLSSGQPGTGSAC
jgi:hypothetical protein